jgi:NAD(P)-dependent dehydrogenase (short-subunit alcohol dehydrogenase family)
MKNLKDKVVVITGAGSGIGRALALEAAQKGARLALSDWNEAGLRETAAQVTALAPSTKVITEQVDQRSEDAVNAFAARVERELGGANVVVNNAGVSLSDTVGSMKRSDFEWVFDINFWGVVRGTESFLPQLLQKEDAHVVNISSVFGLIGVPSQSAYNASKFAVRGYTEALRQELWGTNVHVTCVHPGGVKTNIVRNGRNVRNQFGQPTTHETMSRMFDKMAQTPPAKAANIIWSGVLSNAPRVLVGVDARVIDVIQRLLPTAYPRVFRQTLKWIERANTRN